MSHLELIILIELNYFVFYHLYTDNFSNLERAALVNFIGPRNFSRGTYDFSPVHPFVRLFVCNAFSLSLMRQIF